MLYMPSRLSECRLQTLHCTLSAYDGPINYVYFVILVPYNGILELEHDVILILFEQVPTSCLV